MSSVDVLAILNNIRTTAYKTHSITKTVWLIDEYIKRLSKELEALRGKK